MLLTIQLTRPDICPMFQNEFVCVQAPFFCSNYCCCCCCCYVSSLATIYQHFKFLSSNTITVIFRPKIQQNHRLTQWTVNKINDERNGNLSYLKNKSWTATIKSHSHTGHTENEMREKKTARQSFIFFFCTHIQTILLMHGTYTKNVQNLNPVDDDQTNDKKKSSIDEPWISA